MCNSGGLKWPLPLASFHFRLLACLLFGKLLTSTSAAEESDNLRGYLNLRGADTNPRNDIHDAWGIGMGINLNRYVGLELAGDNFEKPFEPGGYEKLGEYAVWSFVPQVRLRYPMLKGRLVPYVIGGVGGAFTQFNDRKYAGFGLDIKTDSSALVGAFGGGIEYFVAHNISVGFEIKYLATSDQEVQVEGKSYGISASAPLIMMSVRLHYPENKPAPPAELLDFVPARVYYGGLRAGGAIPVHNEVFPGIKAEPEPPAYGGTLDQLFGILFGVNFGRHWSAEVTIDGFETVLNLDGVGSIGEYAVVSIIPQARLRYPWLEGRLVPYAVGGVGLGYNEFNDRKPAGADVIIDDGKSYSVAASLGAGIEYYVTSNIAFNFETRYLFSRGQSIRIDGGPERDGNFDSVLFSFGLRVFFPGWH
jgi:opacity protein-like surface antigen